MSQRTWNQHINYMGNVNRIMEMHRGGCKEHQISGVFLDEGIDIRPHQVRATIESHDAMCSKRLPKEAAKNAINHNTQNKPLDLGGDLQPA